MAATTTTPSGWRRVHARRADARRQRRHESSTRRVGPRGGGERRRRRTSIPAQRCVRCRNLVTRFDAHKSSNGYDQNWLAPVYDRLIWQTPEVELEPGLATEWGFTDDLHFEMTLREGVTFSDGTPFDAKVVAANIDRAKNVEGSGLAAYLASVDTVEVVDPTHVRFVLNRPDATLPMQLATRPGMMISPAAFENPDLDSNPVGSGPYELVEYHEGDMAAYERRDDYWNPDYAGVKRIELYYIPDSMTRLNGLRTGRSTPPRSNPSQIEEAEGIDGVDVTVSDTIQLYHFQLDRTKSEFGDPLVRRAMAHAIDRQSIIDAIFFGYGTLATQWVAPDTPYYVDDLGESTTYDPELARELLAEAGLPDGFTFDAMTSVQPTYVKLAEVLQGMFAEVGITMNVTQEPNLADAFFVRNATTPSWRRTPAASTRRRRRRSTSTTSRSRTPAGRTTPRSSRPGSTRSSPVTTVPSGWRRCCGRSTPRCRTCRCCTRRSPSPRPTRSTGSSTTSPATSSSPASRCRPDRPGPVPGRDAASGSPHCAPDDEHDPWRATMKDLEAAAQWPSAHGSWLRQLRGGDSLEDGWDDLCDEEQEEHLQALQQRHDDRRR